MRALLAPHCVLDATFERKKIVGNNFYAQEEGTERLFKIQSFRILDPGRTVLVEWALRKKSKAMMDAEQKEEEEAEAKENRRKKKAPVNKE
ncbi:hypothetical protein GCK72_025193 [Caenorhabditis remanei]|uniref:Uncharacterized protein n=1 Tax=Caenorhabditis remanei TaxID=31234 RepID=A0A6A5G199_CAERE|nr:hypothetical protein GCK72_025193 [Caenorhabditis remanei]KAF1748726.1 hypothetical protein GCK72_025193 [Caenorhabditis remanei]